MKIRVNIVYENEIKQGNETGRERKQKKSWKRKRDHLGIQAELRNRSAYLSDLWVVWIVTHANVWHLHFLASRAEARVQRTLGLRSQYRLSNRKRSWTGSCRRSIMVNRSSGLRSSLLLLLWLWLLLGLLHWHGGEGWSRVDQSWRLSSALSSQAAPAKEEKHAKTNDADDEEDADREASVSSLAAGRCRAAIMFALHRQIAVHYINAVMKLASNSAVRAERSGAGMAARSVLSWRSVSLFISRFWLVLVLALTGLRWRILGVEANTIILIPILVRVLACAPSPVVQHTKRAALLGCRWVLSAF